MDSATVGSPDGKFVLREAVALARARVKGSKRALFFLALAVLAVSLPVGLLLGPDPLAGWSWSRLPYDLLSCLISGIGGLAATNLGLLRAAGERATFGALFRHMDRLPYVLLLSVPLYFVGTYGPKLHSGWWALLYVPLSLLAVFWMYFVIDREVGPLEGVVSSYRLVLDNLGAYLKYVLLTFLLVAPGAALFVVGAMWANPVLLIVAALIVLVSMLWIYPFFLIAQGAMYAQAVGLRRDYRRQ